MMYLIADVAGEHLLNFDLTWRPHRTDPKTGTVAINTRDEATGLAWFMRQSAELFAAQELAAGRHVRVVGAFVNRAIRWHPPDPRPDAEWDD